MGIKDLLFYKQEFEINLQEANNELFNFYFFDYQYIGICASAVWSPIESYEKKIILKKEDPLEYIFINVIPEKENLRIILGHHSKFSNIKISKYIESWNLNSPFDEQEKLTDLVVTKVSSWAMSPQVFYNISPSNKKIFQGYWNANYMNLSSEQKTNINIFK